MKNSGAPSPKSHGRASLLYTAWAVPNAHTDIRARLKPLDSRPGNGRNGAARWLTIRGYITETLNAELTKRGVAGNDPAPGTAVGTVINHYHPPVTQHSQTISASGGATISGVNQAQRGGAGGDQNVSASDHGEIKDVDQRIE